MRAHIRASAALLLLGLGTAAAAQDPPNQPDQEPGRLKESRIAARINNEIVTSEEMEALYREAGARPEDTDLRKALLKKEAERRLFMQEAAKLGIEITKEQVDKAIEGMIRSLGGRDAFDRWLVRRQRTHAQHREDQKIQLLAYAVFERKYRQWLYEPGSETPPLHDFVTPQEMEGYWRANPKEFHAPESVSLYRLTIRYRTEAERLEAVRRAESIRRKVLEGFTAFDIIAQVESGKGLQARLDGLERTTTLFAKATVDLIFSLPEGKLSDIVTESGAIHLFKVFEKRPAREESFDEAQPRIRTSLQVEKQRANRELLLREMLKSAYYWPRDLFE
jgi:peptidyl-prolyl cis-trans isomerase C